MKLRLEYEVDGEKRQIALDGDEIRLGRGSDNHVVLPDFSVSRQHARLRRDGSEWSIEDLDSTNGIQHNGQQVSAKKLVAGDVVTLGVFELRVSEAPSKLTSANIPNATMVRRLSDFSSELGAIAPGGVLPAAPTEAADLGESGPQSGTRRFFDLLNRLARDLIQTNTSDEVLQRVMEIAFAALPIDRGFILLGRRSGDAECRLARIGDRVELRPEGDVPVSQTILQTVMEEEVGLMTLDALDDQRLQGGDSIRIHGIRAAMCAPLWSGGQITGFVQVDSPFHAGSFSEQDLDFLITLANYAAVGVQRTEERRLRGRLERYHSPSVIQDVLSEEWGSGAGPRGLRKQDVTVLFADLVDFTAFSETASLEQVADLLSGYCSRSVAAIFDQGGTLDKFIGDCVMAFWGAPMKYEDHAARAVRAALAIQRAMAEWNEERRSAGLPEVHCRMALNSGGVVVGDVGSEQRVDYTVLGNVVNVASRLESSVAKPDQIVVGASTREHLGEGFSLEPLGEFALKGLQQKATAYRVIEELAAQRVDGQLEDGPVGGGPVGGEDPDPAKVQHS